MQNIKVEADALKVRLLNEMIKKDEEISKKVAEEKKDFNKEDDKEEVKPKPPVKKRRSISIKNISKTSSWQIETLEDLEEYMDELKEQIKKELKEDTIIDIEF